MGQYLREQQYYGDLYDLFTIREGIRIIKTLQRAYKERLNDKSIKHLPKGERIKGFTYLFNSSLFTYKGERYKHRSETIQKWMNEAKTKQDLYDNTQIPTNINCSKCGGLMELSFKELIDYLNKPLRMLFFFKCTRCVTRRAVYDNKEEYKTSLITCTKCGSPVKEAYSREGEVVTWTRTCMKCGNKEVEIDNFEQSRRKWEDVQAEDRLLLNKYKADFCLTDEKGREYIELMEKLEVAEVVKEEAKQEYLSPYHQKVLNIKKLDVSELEKVLRLSLQKIGFIKLSFDKPGMGQFILVPFTVQVTDSSKTKEQSVQHLQKAINKLVKDTNWRLVQHSLSYRLGYISGQLKGYEREDDLMQLECRGIKHNSKSPKIDEKLRLKYLYDPFVQYARMDGEFEAKESLRKERLKKEPKGFCLDEPNSTYTCGICYESTKGDKIWWDEHGIRCLDCQRNINKGIAPYEICTKDDIWFRDSSINTDFGIHPSLIKKLRRLGMLTGRDFKRDDGIVYLTIYLVKDNKEFLKKYPIKNRKRFKLVDPVGKEIII